MIIKLRIDLMLEISYVVLVMEHQIDEKCKKIIHLDILILEKEVIHIELRLQLEKK